MPRIEAIETLSVPRARDCGGFKLRRALPAYGEFEATERSFGVALLNKQERTRSLAVTVTLQILRFAT